MRQAWLKQNNIFSRKGFSLVEVVVGAAIMLLIVFGVVSTYLFYLRISISNPLRVKATLMAEEGIEVLKFLRDGHWSSVGNLAVSTDYYLNFDGLNWSISEEPQYSDLRFDRKFTVENVYRDLGGNIVSSGGTFDPGTKKIIMEMNWRTQGGTTTRHLSTYLANIFND